MLQIAIVGQSDWPIIFLISGSKDGGPTLKYALFPDCSPVENQY